MTYKTFSIPTKRSDKSKKINAAQVEHELKEQIEGEVRFDDGTRAMYATDSSNYHQVPIGVVIPKTEEDIENTLKICHKHKAAVVSRGGGTSLAGQCCNVAVVMDMSKYYNEVLEIDHENRTATVQPGIVLDTMNRHAKKHGLTFGPDPSTHNRCTIGGMMGNNSCGTHSVMAVKHGFGARSSDNLVEMDVLTVDGIKLKVGKTSEEELNNIILEGGRKGEIYGKLRAIRDTYADEIRSRYPKIPRRVSGYNLDELLPENGFNVARALAGTESTCVTILSAKVHLIPNPGYRSLLVLGYPDIADAGANAPKLLKYGPIAVEGLDHNLYDFMVNRNSHVQDLKLLPEGKAWLLVEFEGKDKKEADGNVKSTMEELKKLDNPPSMVFYDDTIQEAKLWNIRESGLGTTAFVPGLPDAWEGWEDSAVHPEKLGDYLKDFRKLLDKYDYTSALYGHFGQGLIHCRIDFDLVTAKGITKFRKYLDEAADLVIKYDGSISGEHGDGQSKAELLPKMFGEKLIEAFREFKSAWDPEGLMNPGKVSNPYPIVSNLRLGTKYSPPQPKTHFKFPDDEGSFSRAVLRCVGVGLCRKTDSGTMCPSYMVTREEQHSTRGRAHKLFEMMRGETIKGGWKDESVKEALDLCLACKGCKGECPVNVDMATYKAEFLAHYYKFKLRPLSNYLFGYIAYWSRIATKFPRIANILKNSKFTGGILKKISGMAHQRTLPDFAEVNFRDWFLNRKVVNEGKTEVVLWADTFNNYFNPEVAIAATEVLEHLGFKVIVLKQKFCCGRPLYDFGMLETAKKWLGEIIENLKEYARKDIAIIGLEPSCVSVFRDEMHNLFPNVEDAKRLGKNVYMLSEFLEKRVKDYDIPELKKKVLLHGHCHEKSVLAFKAEEEVLKKMGIDCSIPDSGCCGMAGSFGYDSANYDIAIKAGERVLAPAIRKSEETTLVATNGFSCKKQILDQTGRKTLHFAQVLKMAIDEKEKKVVH